MKEKEGQIEHEDKGTKTSSLVVITEGGINVVLSS